MSLSDRIKRDLAESKIDWKVALLFIPAAFITYLFHEFGHWVAGELLGNDMVISLNNAAPRSGYYIDETHSVYVSIGGPLFTILQAIIVLVIIQKTRSVYAYPFLFFAVFSRFFSLIFGGFDLQDEAKISALLDIGAYTAAVIVLSVLFLILWRSSHVLKIKPKAIGYYTVLGTLSILLVIYIDKLFL
jgi:hypothetical protein